MIDDKLRDDVWYLKSAVKLIDARFVRVCARAYRQEVGIAELRAAIAELRAEVAELKADAKANRWTKADVVGPGKD